MKEEIKSILQGLIVTANCLLWKVEGDNVIERGCEEGFLNKLSEIETDLNFLESLLEKNS